MARVSTTLSCHLESADSVRTNPQRRDYQTQFNRLFAEAFVCLLLGQRLQFGQVPLFDSYGLVQFLGELTQAMNPLYQERKRELGEKSPFRPLVLTHYPALTNGQPIRDRKDALRLSFLVALQDERFIHSATPALESDKSLRKRLASEIAKSEIGMRVDNFSPSLLKDLEYHPSELSHLRHMETIDHYVRINASQVVRANSHQSGVGLDKSLRAMLELENRPQGYDYIVDFYQRMINLEGIEKLDRSNIYAAADREFGATDARALVIEMVDSLYMWNQSRLAGANSETTSSGVDSNDADVLRMGEEVSAWADRVKQRWHRDDPSWETRPVLQKGSIDNEERLSDHSYRRRLLTALAEFIVHEQFAAHTVETVRGFGVAGNSYDVHRRVEEHWAAIAGRANRSPLLSDLIRVDITTLGTFHVQFKEHRHCLAGMLPGSTSEVESHDRVQETIRNNFEAVHDSCKDHLGAEVPIAGIAS